MRSIVIILVSTCLSAAPLRARCQEVVPAISARPGQPAVTRAVKYLSQELVRWRSEKSCHSCHHFGDAARVLYLAKRRGYPVDNAVLEPSLRMLREPSRWETDAGDEPFQDHRLSAIQYSSALRQAAQAKADEAWDLPRNTAARLVASHQQTNGLWKISAGGLVGSPITYGNILATAIARQVLREADDERFPSRIAAADRWLREQQPHAVVDLAGLILGLDSATDEAAQRQRERARRLLIKAQQADGGWGMFANHPAEVFDTAIAVIALSSLTGDAEASTGVDRGQRYLRANQLPEGCWPETTRPAGSESYAHRVSTTAWALQALLMTPERDQGGQLREPSSP